MRFAALPILALAGLTGCMSLHAQIPEEAVLHHMAHEDGIEVAAICSHEGQRYSEGAIACMAGQRMSCDPSGRWVGGGDC